MDQQLWLRGGRDFPSQEEYVEFIRALVAVRNRNRGASTTMNAR